MIASVVSAGTDGTCFKYAPPQFEGIGIVIIPGTASSELMGTNDPTDITVNLIVLVPKSYENWQRDLDSFISGERSIFAALDGGVRDLRAAGVSADTDGWDQYGEKEWAGSSYWTVRVPVELMV